jgi:hypothetical protein
VYGFFKYFVHHQICVTHHISLWLWRQGQSTKCHFYSLLTSLFMWDDCCILNKLLIFSLVSYLSPHLNHSTFYKLLIGSSTTVKELLGSAERRVTEDRSDLCSTSWHLFFCPVATCWCMEENAILWWDIYGGRLKFAGILENQWRECLDT